MSHLEKKSGAALDKNSHQANSVEHASQALSQEAWSKSAAARGAEAGKAAGKGVSKHLLAANDNGSKTVESGKTASAEVNAGANQKVPLVTPARLDSGPLPRFAFADRAIHLFEKIDLNKDGLLESKELAGAMENPQFKGQDAQAVLALYKNGENLKTLSKDNFLFERGVSVSDLLRYEEILVERDSNWMNAIQTKSMLSEKAADPKYNKIFKNPNAKSETISFSKVDGDSDGFLSRQELNTALSREENPFVGDHYKYILRNFDKIKAASFDGISEFRGISTRDLKNHPGDVLNKFDSAAVVSGVESTLADSASRLNSKAVYSLYAGSKPQESIKPEAVKQGYIGDCYLLAAVSSVAKSDPGSIARMIKDNHDGTYTVRFPGAADKSFKVKAPTEAETLRFNGAGRYGVWVNVLEKAYGKYRQENKDWLSRLLDRDENKSPAEGADGGGLPSEALQMLTGRTGGVTATSDFKEKDLRDRLQASTGNSLLPLVAVRQASLLSQIFPEEGDRKSPVVKNHAYSVLSFSPAGKDGGTVVVRNPWGRCKQSETSYGVMKMSLKQFMTTFDYLYS